MICPKCNGRKIASFPLFLSKESAGKIINSSNDELECLFTCFNCKGTGEISTEQQQWILDGKILKDLRLRNKITLRQASMMIKMSPITLSEMERGIIKPNLKINYSTIRVIKK